MWRYLAGGAAALALAGAGTLLLGGRAPSGAEAALPPMPAATLAAETQEGPGDPPEASPRSREQKRFDRYDKDRDGGITREEYLQSRRKAYAKLDRDGDGRLSFDEWSVKTINKFARADRDHSGRMDAAEFATTAVKRKPRAKCPPATRPTADGDD